MEFDSDESDYSDHGIDQITIDSVDTLTEEYATLKINGKLLNFKLDSGAEINVLTIKDFQTVVPRKQRNSKLKPSTAKLTSFGGHDIPVVGMCSLKCDSKSNTHVLKFHEPTSSKTDQSTTQSKPTTAPAPVPSGRQPHVSSYGRVTKPNPKYTDLTMNL